MALLGTQALILVPGPGLIPTLTLVLNLVLAQILDCSLRMVLALGLVFLRPCHYGDLGVLVFS